MPLCNPRLPKALFAWIHCYFRIMQLIWMQIGLYYKRGKLSVWLALQWFNSWPSCYFGHLSFKRVSMQSTIHTFHAPLPSIKQYHPNCSPFEDISSFIRNEAIASRPLFGNRLTGDWGSKDERNNLSACVVDTRLEEIKRLSPSQRKQYVYSGWKELLIVSQPGVRLAIFGTWFISDRMHI